MKTSSTTPGGESPKPLILLRYAYNRHEELGLTVGRLGTIKDDCDLARVVNFLLYIDAGGWLLVEVLSDSFHVG